LGSLAGVIFEWQFLGIPPLSTFALLKDEYGDDKLVKDPSDLTVVDQGEINDGKQ